MRRFLLTAATAATALVGTACGDVIGIGDNVAGSYELRTINGQSLPVQLGSRTYEGGVLELDNDGTFVEVLQFREFGDPLSIHEEFFGNWDRNGNELRLEYNDDSRTVLFAERTSSSRLVLEDGNGNDWVYQRF